MAVTHRASCPCVGRLGLRALASRGRGSRLRRLPLRGPAMRRPRPPRATAQPGPRRALASMLALAGRGPRGRSRIVLARPVSRSRHPCRSCVRFFSPSARDSVCSGRASMHRRPGRRFGRVASGRSHPARTSCRRHRAADWGIVPRFCGGIVPPRRVSC